MNERIVPKKTNFCVVKLSNSPAITYVPRLELDHFESQHDSPRINQRLPRKLGQCLHLTYRHALMSDGQALSSLNLKKLLLYFGSQFQKLQIRFT